MLFVNFKDKLRPILGMEFDHSDIGYETSRREQASFMKNWRNEKEHFEKLILEVFMKWKN